ncbi:substrate-binding domain-containing protein [Polaromonas sp. YR568]|uniref:substrate-binding domain-containing protein n=1 Tax=Polaromonas sp. YR568 TaxID=1855301 RepID=UPI00398BEF88
MNLKRKVFHTLAATALAAAACISSAQTVVGGGTPYAAALYGYIITNGGVPGIWSYTGTGSSAGREAFLQNNPQAVVGGELRDENTAGRPVWPTSQTVHFAASDLVLSAAQIATYNAAYGAGYGPLIQVPVAAIPVLLPYKETGITSLNLSAAQACRIFSFQPSSRTWNQVTTAADDGAGGSVSAIEVAYRTDTNGATESLSRFLNAACGLYLPAGKSFTVSSNFRTAVASALPALTAAQDANGDGIPDVWVAATGSGGMTAAVATNHRLGYLTPDSVYTISAGGLVARIDGFLPNAASIQAAMPAPPTGIAGSNPLNWVPAYTYSATMYPIYGTTHLLLGQCYVGGMVAGSAGVAVRQFVAALGGVAYPPPFINMPAPWNAAIGATFLDPFSALAIGNTSVCNGIGRP